MLVQVASVRASIVAWFVLERLFVFRPSVSRMMTCWVPAGSGGALTGSPVDWTCQPQTRPMVWLVLPAATISSTLALSAVQSEDSGMIFASVQFRAGKYVVVFVDVGAVFWASNGLSRSAKQPFQLIAPGMQFGSSSPKLQPVPLKSSSLSPPTVPL